jgi:hypothetical protein
MPLCRDARGLQILDWHLSPSRDGLSWSLVPQPSIASVGISLFGVPSWTDEVLAA